MSYQDDEEEEAVIGATDLETEEDDIDLDLNLDEPITDDDLLLGEDEDEELAEEFAGIDGSEY